ncbi:hypothetical protein G6F42_013404 [Rhizopus arrhizus]|nr:hypothetical protein G6F42_013404 [Rhizopus arrhizus]
MRGIFQDKVEGDFSDSKTEQRFILYGAVEGGPNIDDTWYDDRSNYEYSEVTQDYNAAWTGAIAGLIDFYGSQKFEPYTDCDLDLGWSHPNASEPPAWPEDDCYHTCNTGCPRGQMKSSFTWKLLTEPQDQIHKQLDVLYPGQGMVKAAALEGKTLADLKAMGIKVGGDDENEDDAEDDDDGNKVKAAGLDAKSKSHRSKQASGAAKTMALTLFSSVVMAMTAYAILL